MGVGGMFADCGQAGGQKRRFDGARGRHFAHGWEKQAGQGRRDGASPSSVPRRAACGVLCRPAWGGQGKAKGVEGGCTEAWLSVDGALRTGARRQLPCAA